MDWRALSCDEGFDWRDQAHYHYTIEFTDRDWAWEGLRRNPGFRAAWQQSHAHFDCSLTKQDVTIVRAVVADTGLDRWGILYSESPQLDARNAAIFWNDPRASVLHAVALDGASLDDVSAFRIGNVSCRSALLIGPSGSQHLLLRGCDCQLQLCVSGASVLAPVRLVSDIIYNGSDLKRHLGSLAMFNDLRISGHSELSDAVPKRRAERLRSVLQALDGFLAGATL